MTVDRKKISTQGSFKPLSKVIPMTKFEFLIVWNALSHFPRKRFQLRKSKIYKKTEQFQIKMFRTFVLQLKVASKSFFKILPMTKFGFTPFRYKKKSFKHFVMLSQKSVLTLSLKNLQKTKKMQNTCAGISF